MQDNESRIALEPAQCKSDGEGSHIGSHGVLEQCRELVAAIEGEMSPANPGVGRKAGGVEETLADFLHHIGVDGISVAVLEVLVAGLRIEHEANLHTECELEASVAVHRVGGVPEFHGRLKVGCSKLGFLEMRGVGIVAEFDHGGGLGDADMRILEDDVIGRDAGSEGHAQLRVGLEGEVEQEVDVDALRKSRRLDAVRAVGPAGVAQLDHEVIICPAGEVDRFLLRFGGFLCEYGRDKQAAQRE